MSKDLLRKECLDNKITCLEGSNAKVLTILNINSKNKNIFKLSNTNVTMRWNSHWTQEAGTHRGSVSTRLAAVSSWLKATAKSALTIVSSKKWSYKNSILAEDLIMSLNSSSWKWNIKLHTHMVVLSSNFSSVGWAKKSC